MKKAIDLSESFTAALKASQADTLGRLDELAKACSSAINEAELRAVAIREALDRSCDDTVHRLSDIRGAALRLAAEIRDGSDDGAEIVHAALKMPKARTLEAVPASAEPVERAA